MNLSILYRVHEVAAVAFVFLIRLRFPQSKSMSEIIKSIYGDTAIKRLRRFEKIIIVYEKLNLIWNFKLDVEIIT